MRTYVNWIYDTSAAFVLLSSSCRRYDVKINHDIWRADSIHVYHAYHQIHQPSCFESWWSETRGYIGYKQWTFPIRLRCQDAAFTSTAATSHIREQKYLALCFRNEIIFTSIRSRKTLTATTLCNYVRSWKCCHIEYYDLICKSKSGEQRPIHTRGPVPPKKIKCVVLAV